LIWVGLLYEKAASFSGFAKKEAAFIAKAFMNIAFS